MIDRSFYVPGDLPSGWIRRRLRFDCKTNPKKSEITVPPETEVSFVPMEAVGELGGLDLEQTRAIDDVYDGYTYLANGDVCVAKITPCFENGKGAVAHSMKNNIGFGTTELHVLRAKDNLSAQFLFYVTISDPFRAWGTAEMLGAGGQKRVPEGFIKDWPLARPPLAQQHRIADFLDERTARIDGLIARKHRLLALLAEKRQALITHAVTKGLDPTAPLKPSGIDWLGDIPAHWRVAPLWSRFAVELGKMLDEKRIRPDRLDPYLRNVDVQWGAINTDALPMMTFDENEEVRYALRKNDLLVCEGGEVGRAAVWEGKIERCFYQKALHRLRPITNDAVPKYMLLVLECLAKLGVFKSRGNPNTIDHLTAEAFRHYRLAWPSKGEQENIVKFLSEHTERIGGIVTKVRTSIQRLQEYRAALITAAVTGQLTLPDA